MNEPAARSALAVLNELSLPADVDADHEDDIVTDVVTLSSVLRNARKFRGDLALVTHISLGSVVVMRDGRTLATVMTQRGGRAREAWRSIQISRNHAPFAAAPSLVLADHGEEHRYDGLIAEGLGAACANRQIAVSIPAPRWDAPVLAIARHWLHEDEEGTVTERQESLDVHHASRPAHVAHHEQLIRQLALPSPFSGHDLWDDRSHLYPHLAFLPRVEAQLAAMPAGSEHKNCVAKRLGQLEAAAAGWDPTVSPTPAWTTRTTPEAEQRKRHCWFTDLDGEERCFDWHARYTPGVGRIHFRMDAAAAAPRLVIAHIGLKLGER